ncbi:MAG: chemotaxis protein CheA [Woeseia sp.]
MSFDLDMAEIAQLFVEESVEGLDIMESGLLNLDLGNADTDIVNGIFRAAHSIKGGGATFGFNEVSEFAHHVETLLDEMRQGKRQVTRESVDILLQSVDCLRAMIAGLASGDVDMTVARSLEAEFARLLGNSGAADGDNVSPTEGASSNIIGWDIGFRPLPTIFKSCNDPLRIIRELDKLGDLAVICEGADALRQGEFNAEECQLAWQFTLCGAVSREAIEEVFAWVVDECELTLAPICEPVSEPAVPEVTSGNDAHALSASAMVQPQAAQENVSIRVKIDKVDALINLVGELVITQSMLSRFGGDFDFTKLQSLREGLAQLSRNTRELQESVMAIRMLPISFAFSRFSRLVRDTSNAIGKKVELKLSGEHTELDKTVLEKIGDPLVHLVRNSLDHGLETPAARKAAGKPETGLLELSAYHEGGYIIIDVIDDGAGIDQQKVVAKALERGLISGDEDLTPDEINNLIFQPGFSTAELVSDLSGRGVGMDVVRRNIADLGGNVTVQSERGRGSKFTIRLPLTLAILDGQLIRVGRQTYIVSLVNIIETIQVKAGDYNQLAGGSELFKLRDQYLPVLRLHELFGIEADCKLIEDGLIVVAEAHGQRVGILVDELQEQQQVVIKSLEANYKQTAGISGATILGDGTVALIVDVPGLLRLFLARNGKHQSVAA